MYALASGLVCAYVQLCFENYRHYFNSVKKGTPNTVFCPKVLTPVHIVQRLNGQRDPYMRPTLVQKGIYSVIFQPGISMNNTYLYNGAKCSRACIRDCTASFVWLSYVVK